MKDFKNLSIGDYLRMLWRRRWYFVITSFVITSGITLYAWRLPHFYVSEARILVESSYMPEDLVRPIVRTTAEEKIVAIREQLYSRSFLEKLVEGYQLFGYGSNRAFVMAEALERLRIGIKFVNNSRDSFSITYSSTDPRTAQTMVQRIVEGLLQANVANRQTKAQVTDQFIDGQLRQIESDLAAQEEKIKIFKRSHSGELPEEAVSNMAALANLRAQLAAADSNLEQLKQQRNTQDYRLQEQERLKMLSRDLFAVPPPSRTTKQASATREKPASPVEQQLAAKRSQLTEMRSKYRSSHPDVLRATREVEELEKQVFLASAALANAPSDDSSTPSDIHAGSEPPSAGIPDGLEFVSVLETSEIKLEIERTKSAIAKAERERGEISRQIALLQSRLSMAPTLEQEYSGLTRDYENLRQQYRNIQDKKFQAAIATNAETDRKNESLRVLDQPSLPEKPAFPNRTQIAIIGCAASIILGLGAAFAREFFDPCVSTENEVAGVLRLPVLISILDIPSEGDLGVAAKKLQKP